MKTRARFVTANRSLDDELIVSFAVDEINLDELKDKEFEIDIHPLKKLRSLTANAYFWKLCDKIAKKLKSDKQTIYLMQLKDSGVFEVIDVILEGIPTLEKIFRLVEIDYIYTSHIFNEDGEEQIVMMASCKCYYGSHEYDTKQMSELIDSTVRQSQDLGIETMTPDEIEHMCSLWRPR